MADFNPVVGIDLGLMFSKIAYINEFGKPIVIPNQEYKLTTPSVVHFHDKNTFAVGDEAVNCLMAYPDYTVSFIKRSMGDPNFKRNIHGEDYTPQEISALILRKLKRVAESYFKNVDLDIEVKDVVITVPAYFGMEQKRATKQAGELADLNVLMIIDEPTAAALAYGINKLGKDQTVFVFDLGATLDVTILEIKEEKIFVIESDGDVNLGDREWDDVLTIYCSKSFKEKYGEDPQDDPDSYQELYLRVLKAKISLSKLPKAQIRVMHGGNTENIEITRENFEELSRDLLEQCKICSGRVLKNANKTWDDIDTIILSGGATYMPMIRNLITEMSSKKPVADIQPDLCVAIGAAIQGYFINHPVGCTCCEEFFRKRDKEQKATRKKALVDLPEVNASESTDKTSRISNSSNNLTAKEQIILPYNIGLTVLNSEGQEDVYVLFAKGTKLPAEIKNSYAIAYDEQSNLRLNLIKGVGKNVEDYMEIGEIIMEFKSPMKMGEPCEISYMIFENEALRVKSKCKDEEAEAYVNIFQPSLSDSSLTFDDTHGKTYYEILRIPENADYNQVNEAYERAFTETLIWRNKEKVEARRFELNSAWSCLKDPVQRKTYDEMLKEYTDNKEKEK